MTDVSYTPANIAPLPGALTRSYDAGGTLENGNACYIASDGDVEASDANTAATVDAIGIVVAVQNNTMADATAAADDAVTVVTFGPVAGFSGMTPGTRLWVSVTTGKISDTEPSGAGTWSKQIGYAESASVIFVQPMGTPEPESNS